MKKYLLTQINEIRSRWAKTHDFSSANPMLNEITGMVLNAPSLLPDIEVVSAKVHEEWMKTKRVMRVDSRKAEDGEELMVPYDQLSEKAKDLDRNTVKAVYAAILEIEKM